MFMFNRSIVRSNIRGDNISPSLVGVAYSSSDSHRRTMKEIRHHFAWHGDVVKYGILSASVCSLLLPFVAAIYL